MTSILMLTFIVLYASVSASLLMQCTHISGLVYTVPKGSSNTQDESETAECNLQGIGSREKGTDTQVLLHLLLLHIYENFVCIPFLWNSPLISTFLCFISCQSCGMAVLIIFIPVFLSKNEFSASEMCLTDNPGNCSPHSTEQAEQEQYEFVKHCLANVTQPSIKLQRLTEQRLCYVLQI